MSCRMHHALGFISLVFAVACNETGQERIELPLYARGLNAEPFEVDGFSVTLDEARVGVGPIYVCASARSSSDLCSSAVAEFTNSGTVDALDGSWQRLGTLDGLTASARSIGLDYALTWPTSVPEAVALPGAPQGHSAVFSGHAQRDDRSFAFHAEIDLVPPLRGTRVVQGLSTRAQLSGELRCELTLDAVAWWSQVDFEALAAGGGDTIALGSDSAASAALRTAMTSNATPTFSWPHQ